MQPTSDQPDRAQQSPPQYTPSVSPYSAPGGPPYASSPPPVASEQGTGGWPGPAFAPPVPAATVKKARPWRVAIVAFLTFLVLIAGLGNQWVTDAIGRHVVGRSFFDDVARSVTVYSWRFAPRGSHDFARVWLGDLCLVGTALVLTLLLVAVIARGPGGFGQAFLGTWMSVLFATVIGGYVQVAVIQSRLILSTSNGKASDIFFSSVSPGPFVIAAALGFGFVVAMVAGLTAVLSRRTEVITAPVPAGYGAPAFGAPADEQPAWTAPPAASVPGPIASPSPWGGTDTVRSTDSSSATESTERASESDEPQHTAVLPSVDEPARDSNTESTTQLPRSYGSDEQTTQLPRTEPSSDDDGPRHLSE